MRNADISCALRMASWRRELRYAAVSSGDSRRIGRVRDTRSIALLRIASVHPGKNTAECLRHGTLDVVNAFASMSEWLRAGSNWELDQTQNRMGGSKRHIRKANDHLSRTHAPGSRLCPSSGRPATFSRSCWILSWRTACNSWASFRDWVSSRHWASWSDSSRIRVSNGIEVSKVLQGRGDTHHTVSLVAQYD